ncbi:hypothetical protein [Olivibacter domesticus]|uniref:Lipoprotein n=1 Tax=Olivibacter domesticus TaxID=407022 RepID=A0A1H7VG40_OLID1|nr:hypothetical protein [Olivibacter domesticus]SEM07839.1 hypothetical protein SAMN05661044_04156 [Olivibacter domesticus]
MNIILLLAKRLLFSILFLTVVSTALSCAQLTVTEITSNNAVGAVVRDSLTTQYVDSMDYFSRLYTLANDTAGKWPVLNQPLPLQGAILPYNRIIAFYGNLYSTRMGILGELPPKQMLAKLDQEVARWNRADSSLNAIPALHYIAVTAQGDPGKDGKHRLRMPSKQIDSVLSIAAMRDHMLVFLDIQIGLSNLEQEIPRLEKYLQLPFVHLGIDPEFSMKDGSKPGSRIGNFHAQDINYASDFLAQLVRKYRLPPKILVVHRFTKAMVQQYQAIKLREEVQFVMEMDGWGAPELKKGTYRHFIYAEPVQFTGFKLFYKNDIKQAPKRMLTPEELLKLKPKPIYIQYQ